MDPITLHVLLVIFVATLVRSAFGFGEALFAVPLLAMRLPLGVSAPLAVLISITVAAVIIAQDWRRIHLHSTGWLFSSTLLGIPLGILLLSSSHQRAVIAAMALLIIAFAVYSLIGIKPPELKQDNMAWLLGCGFFAGVLGGAYGMNGPPLVIYGAMRRWSAQHFRATLQGYFLPASIVGMIGYWWKGLWVPAVTHYYLLSLPVALPAVLLGRIVNHRLPNKAFLGYIYLSLAVIGVILFIQAMNK